MHILRIPNRVSMKKILFSGCFSFCFFLFFTATTATPFAQKIDKAFSALNQFNYFEAKTLFEKSGKKFPCLSNYGLSVIFFRNDNPFHNIDSAYRRINASITAYQSPSKSEISKLLNHSIDGNKLLDLKSSIEKRAFEKASEANNIAALNHFIELYTTYSGHAKAVQLRDSLAFAMARKENSSAAYYQFMQQYSDSYLAPEAKVRYEKCLYDESVFDGLEQSYAHFITAYPDNPYVKDAMTKLYALAIKNSNDADVYYQFILKYPNNIHIEDAWQKLLDLNLETFNESNINSFLARYPDYPQRDELMAEMRLLKVIYLPYREGNLTGLLDQNGKIVLEPRYETIGKFHEGIAMVTMNGKIGYINKEVDEIVPPYYDDAENFSNNIAVVGEGGRYGAIIRNGRMTVPLQYNELDDFSEGLAAVSDSASYGYINRVGTVVIPLQFDFAGVFKNGFAICESGELYGVINNSGKVVIPFRYEEMEYYAPGIYKMQSEDNYGLIKSDGAILLKPEFEEIGKLESGRAIIIKDGLLGYAEANGKIVIRPGFTPGRDALVRSQFHNNLAVVRKQKQAGIIDSAGVIVVPFRYDDMVILSDSMASFRQGNRWGLLNITNGKIILPAKYEQITAENNGLLIVAQNGKNGVIDSNGKVLIPFIYQSLSWMNPFSLAGKKNGKYGAVDFTGMMLIPFEYEQFSLWEEQIFEFSSTGGKIWWDAENNKLISPPKLN